MTVTVTSPATLWNFGDGDTSTDPNPSHDFAPPGGAQHVTLTVTDNDDATGTATRDFSVSETASPVTFVGRQSTPTPTAPLTLSRCRPTPRWATRMVLFFAANTTSPTYTYPAGWTAVGGTVTGSGFVGRAFTRVATAADLGTVGASDVVGLRQVRHGTRLSTEEPPGSQPTPAPCTTGAASTAHTSPAVNAPAGSKWLVTYWADKTSSHHRLDTAGRTDLPQQRVRHLGGPHVRPARRQRCRRLRQHRAA